MCYVIGIRVPKKQTVKVGNKDLDIDMIDIPAQSGFAYNQYPVIYSPNNTQALTPTMMHWELIPNWVPNQKELTESRKKYNTLNIKSETIFENKVAQAVVHLQRCLVPVSYFFEWQDIEKQKIPHCISVKETNPFFMAGVWNEWKDHTSGQIIQSFGIITTVANTFMEKIHNTKKRMPTILDTELAGAWMEPNITTNQIQEIAKHAISEDQLVAHTIKKDFLQSNDPTEPHNYTIFSSQTLF